MKKIVCLMLCAACLAPVSARKTTLKLKGSKQQSATTMARGSFMVASQCKDCNNGYRLEQVRFSGFDKPGNSSTESFFITNDTDRTLSGLALYIEYLDAAGRQLHKRYIKLDCDIPAGETRKADVKSWDTQRSFHYEKSPSTKRSAPFSVVFDPVSYYLRY